MNLQGKAFIVTGGGTGIGATGAALLRSLGGEVVILGPERKPLEHVASETGAIAVVGDAASTSDVETALAAIKERAGGLDGLLCCAGGGGMSKLGETDDDSWSQALRITLGTAAVSSRTCLPALAARKGAITILSSIGGIIAPPQSAGYATAKAGLTGLARSIVQDYGPDVRANVLCPGLTKTAMGNKIMDEVGKVMGVDREEAYRVATRWFPLRRAAEPIEIARIAVFLLSDWSSYMTGAVVIADGGASSISPAV